MTCKSGLIASICAKEGDIIGRIVVIEFNNEEQSPFDEVMAAGSFTQGSTIELSADAPMREPFNVYFQGGLTYEHSKFGVIKSVDSLLKKGHISL